MAPLTGGGPCGAGRLPGSEPLGVLIFCHCRRCQRRTGTAFGVAATASPRSVSVTAGAEELRTYTPDTGFAKQFCGRCGSQLFTVDPIDGDVRFVRFGTLDEPPELPVLGHQFVAYAAPWRPLPAAGAPGFEERMPLR